MATLGQHLTHQLPQQLAEIERDIAHAHLLKHQMSGHNAQGGKQALKLERWTNKLNLRVTEKKALAEMLKSQQHLPEVKELTRQLDKVLKALWDLLNDPEGSFELLSEQVRDHQTLKQEISSLRSSLQHSTQSGHVIQAPWPAQSAPAGDPVTAVVLGLAIVLDFLRGWRARNR